MTSETQVRKALAKVIGVADFARRYKHLHISERTIYRQRLDEPPQLRRAVRERLAAALILEGLLPKPEEPTPAPRGGGGKRRKPEAPQQRAA